MRKNDVHELSALQTFYLEKGCCGKSDCKLRELEPGFYHWDDNPVLELSELIGPYGV